MRMRNAKVSACSFLMVLRPPAKAKALTEEKVERKWAEWRALPVDHPLKRVYEAVTDISQDVFYAGFMMDLHILVWDLLFEAKHDEPGGCTLAELEGYLSTVRSLTVEDPDGPWWFVFDLDDTVLGYSVGRRVPLAQWEAMQPMSPRPPMVLRPPAHLRGPFPKSGA